MTLRLREVVLVAIAAIALAACASHEQSPQDEARAAFDDVRKAVKTIVTDPGRAAQVTALVNEVERNFREAAADVGARRAAVQRLASNYDTPQAELEAALAKVRESMRANRKKFGDTRRRLAEILTREEWEALQKERSRALERAVSAALS